MHTENDIFKHVKKKHGHDLIKVIRDFEKKKTKFENFVSDIAFIKLCKKEQLITTFAKVNVSIQNGTYKLKRKIASLVMETELQNKHREKRKLRKDIRHGKKLHNLKLKQETTNYVDERKQSYIKLTVHNFSSYVMSNEEYTALSYGLDHHIPAKSKDVAIEVEFKVLPRLIEKLNTYTRE